MSKAMNLLKTAGFWVAKTAAKEVFNKALPKATPSVVDATKARIKQIIDYCNATPNPYDDVIAVFLADLFDIEIPDKEGN